MRQIKMMRFAACAAVAGLAAGCCAGGRPGYDTLIAHRGESVDAPENTLSACTSGLLTSLPTPWRRFGAAFRP